jgi:DNA-binding LytR/AlgR family response regulator
MLSAPQSLLRQGKPCFVKSSIVHLALREMQAIFASPRTLMCMVAAVLLLGLSGPFGTFEAFDGVSRLVYWLFVVVFSYAFARTAAGLAMALLAPRIAFQPLRILLVSLAASVPAALVVITISAIAYGATSPREWAQYWLYCFAVSLALTAILSVNAEAEAKAAASAQPIPPAPAIFERLPLPARGKLVRLSVADHYVEVVTDKGKTLVLMRLGDAMREVEPTKGLQIHRSHWVALSAVQKSVRVEGKPMVELADGTRLPISRSFLPAAKLAGLIS